MELVFLAECNLQLRVQYTKLYCGWHVLYNKETWILVLDQNLLNDLILYLYQIDFKVLLTLACFPSFSQLQANPFLTLEHL